MADSVADIRADYELAGRMLAVSEGSGAAALIRERRMLRERLEELELLEEVSYVDELAGRRAEAGVVRPPARRSQS